MAFASGGPIGALWCSPAAPRYLCILGAGAPSDRDAALRSSRRMLALLVSLLLALFLAWLLPLLPGHEVTSPVSSMDIAKLWGFFVLLTCFCVVELN